MKLYRQGRKRGQLQQTKLWSWEPKSPTAVPSSQISCRKFLTSACNLGTRGEGVVSNRGGIGKELFLPPSQTPNAHTTNQEETIRMTLTHPHSQTVKFMANRWETILPHTTDTLPTHIKGVAEWIEYNEPNRLCYVVCMPRNAAEEWPMELINGDWYLLTWENTRWYSCGHPNTVSLVVSDLATFTPK